MTTGKIALRDLRKEIINGSATELIYALAIAGGFIGEGLSKLPLACRQAMELNLQAGISQPEENAPLVAKFTMEVALNTSRDPHYLINLINSLHNDSP